MVVSAQKYNQDPKALENHHLINHLKSINTHKCENNLVLYYYLETLLSFIINRCLKRKKKLL